MLSLTVDMMACKECPRVFGHSESIHEVKSEIWPHGWIPPRGWAGSVERQHLPIIIVALNPGHPMDNELAFYCSRGVAPVESGAIPLSSGQAIMEWCTESFDNPGRTRDHIYHRKVLAYIRMALWLHFHINKIAEDALECDWKKYVWITDAFKCTTKNESGPKIPMKYMRDCV